MAKIDVHVLGMIQNIRKIIHALMFAHLRFNKRVDNFKLLTEMTLASFRANMIQLGVAEKSDWL